MNKLFVETFVRKIISLLGKAKTHKARGLIQRHFLVMAFIGILSACSPSPDKGFSLPKGSVAEGEILFTQFQCYECHTIAGTDFVGDEARLSENNGIAVELGGAKSDVQSYADLVTSVINPSHRIAEGYDPDQVTYGDGESKMAYYNSIMTVEELVDIVTFLETKYSVLQRPMTPYPPYH